MQLRQGLKLDEGKALPSWWILALVCLSWIGLWYFTPGLHNHGIGSLLADDDSTIVLLETGAATALLLAIVPLHQRYNRQIFARSQQTLLYALPLTLAAVLPFHYTSSLPLPVYMIWMTVSVFWQDYFTFGLLQSYLRERLPTWTVMGTVSIMFYLGHAEFIPERFAPTQILPALGILGFGLVFSFMRARLGTLHGLLALHLAFYFIFA